MRYDKDLIYHIRRALPWRIVRAYDWIADRFWRGHHILKLSYGYGWADVDTKILYACFDLLAQFVEGEKPFDVLVWDSDNAHKMAAIEIKALHKWWTEERPTRFDPVSVTKCPGRAEAAPDADGHFVMGDYIGTPQEIADWKAACAESHRLEKLWMEEDEAMLHRLIKVRPYLWT